MILLLLPLLTACSSEGDWRPGATGVGNPGNIAQTHARGGDVEFERAEVYTDAYTLEACDGERLRVPVRALVDLTEASWVEIPGGEWCGLEVSWTPPAMFEGQAQQGEGGTFYLELNAKGPTFTLDPAFVLDEHALLVQVGSHEWVKKEDLDLERQAHVEVVPGHPLHDSLMNALDFGSGLYVDVNANGILERGEATPLAQGPDHESEAGS